MNYLKIIAVLEINVFQVNKNVSFSAAFLLYLQSHCKQTCLMSAYFFFSHSKTNGVVKNGINHNYKDSESNKITRDEYYQPQVGTIDSKKTYDYESDIKTDIPTRAGIDGSTTALGGTFIVSNAAIGCGALAFAHAFKEAGGLYVGVVMIFVSTTYNSPPRPSSQPPSTLQVAN